MFNKVLSVLVTVFITVVYSIIGIIGIGLLSVLIQEPLRVFNG
jgi:hypothetical protein